MVADLIITRAAEAVIRSIIPVIHKEWKVRGSVVNGGTYVFDRYPNVVFEFTPDESCWPYLLVFPVGTRIWCIDDDYSEVMDGDSNDMSLDEFSYL